MKRTAKNNACFLQTKIDALISELYGLSEEIKIAKGE
jgi:hypothetical protein